ncbi:MAG: hypothetical protein MUE72_00625, partial [Chitinophagaceae bacterium]|nr:hypothetical protein [Chitinophagaceae bacterium]
MEEDEIRKRLELSRKENEILLKFHNNTKNIYKGFRRFLCYCNNEAFVIAIQETENQSRTFKISIDGTVIASIDASVWQHRLNPFQLFYRTIENTIGILDTNLQVILPAREQRIREIDDKYYEISSMEKSGVMNENFEVIVPMKYHEIKHDAKYKWFFCRKGLQHDWYDEQGNFIMDLPYYKIIVTETDEGPHLIVNKLEPEYYNEEDKYQSRYVEEDERYSKWGLLRSDGSIAIPAEYWKLGISRNHVLLKKYENATCESCDWEKYGLVEYSYELTGIKMGLSDLNHKILIPFEYSCIESIWFKEGL